MPPGHRYSCNLCPKTFKQCGHRDRHLASVHKMGKQLQCPLCDNYETARKDSVRKHMRTVHGIDAEIEGECPICNGMFINVLGHLMCEHVVGSIPNNEQFSEPLDVTVSQICSNPQYTWD